jgi:hypothetical protein
VLKDAGRAKLQMQMHVVDLAQAGVRIVSGVERANICLAVMYWLKEG